MPLVRIIFCVLLLASATSIAQSPSADSPPTSPATSQVQAPNNQSPQPPSYANYSIMLVNPAGGVGVVLMHNPKNELEFVEVNKTSQALSAGYVAVRAAELGEFIGSLKEEIARLGAENARLQNEEAKRSASSPTTSEPSQSELAAQQRAQVDAEKAARRRQMIQTWLMLQNMNRPQPYQLPDPNANRLKTNCTTQTVGSTTYTNCQ